MKRLIIVMQYNPDLMGVGGYEEVRTIPVGRRKGIPEARKQAEVELKVMQKREPDAKFGYVIVAVERNEYRNLTEFTEYAV